MRQDFIVSDTGPLISLEKLSNGYGFIRKLYQKIIVPPTVMDELTQGDKEVYLKTFGITDFLIIQTPKNQCEIPDIEKLHTGEIEAINLAIELKANLLIEELAGKKAAGQLGIKRTGIAGLIYESFSKGMTTQFEALQKLKMLYENKRLDKKTFGILKNKIVKNEVVTFHSIKARWFHLCWL